MPVKSTHAPSEMANREERSIQLEKTNEDLRKLARLNQQIEDKKLEREESHQRLRQMEEATDSSGRWHGASLPSGPSSPPVSDLANSPPSSPTTQSSESSTESEVDVWGPPKKPMDEVETVREEDLSDREDDESTSESPDAPEPAKAREEKERSEGLFVSEAESEQEGDGGEK